MPDEKQPDAYTIAEFCAAHRISRAQYYVLKSKGRAPREMRSEPNSGVRISREAAADWRRSLETQAPAMAG